MKKIFVALVAVIFCASSATFAAQTWTLPESGVQLEGKAKQDYIFEKLDPLWHPAPGAKITPVKFEVPDGWRYEKIDLDGLPVEVLENPDAQSENVVLQLHGGGYVLGLTDSHRYAGVRQAVTTGAEKIFLVDYRIAPQNTFPAAQLDALKAYKEILNRGIAAENIIVLGDSAGGNLALSLSLALKKNNLPQPKCLILISPWTTMENNLPSRKYNETRDLILGKNASPLYSAVKKPAYAKNFSLKNPELSPIYADLKKLSPMLIQVGGYELFLDECIELAKKAAADDVKVTLTIYPEMSHDFALMLPELQDSVDSFAEIKNFVQSVR